MESVMVVFLDKLDVLRDHLEDKGDLVGMGMDLAELELIQLDRCRLFLFKN